LSLKQLNISTAYAIWAGAGTAGVAILGAVLFGESLRWPALLGIVLIIAGVVLVHYFGGAHAQGNFGVAPHAGVRWRLSRSS
jgi:small multidrug resistance pump